MSALPDVWDTVLAAGGVPARGAGFPEELTGLHCRRSTFERAFWSVAAVEGGLSWRTGRAERLATWGDRVCGIVVDGGEIEADLVIVAAGRADRLAEQYRRPGEGGSCGFCYVARMYRARDRASGPTGAVPTVSVYDGYQALIFPQDDDTLSALVVRPTSDPRLAVLRHNDRFAVAAEQIPTLAPWTDPSRFEPITAAMAGSGLSNTYRGQLDGEGKVALAGLFFLGDSVCTTNPAAGRGISLGLLQAAELIRLVLAGGDDYRGAALRFNAWCHEQIRPWYDDHVYWDATLLARFAGKELDVEAAISSDVIFAAAAMDPSMWPVVGPFMAMMAPPTALEVVEDKARVVLRTGWRPAYADGPDAGQLAELVR
jgi:2-polyprenyl-6-methoxyphenol hydroxylase-like FAD-dependent oxidoreductase